MEKYRGSGTGEVSPEDHPVVLARHPVRQAVAKPVDVRYIKTGVSIKEPAEDIARRRLVMGLSVRAVTHEAGEETGMLEIPAGGRGSRLHVQTLIDPNIQAAMSNFEGLFVAGAIKIAQQ